jgi:hypothetical protein
VRADVAIPYGEVSRDDVAATIAELIEQLTVNRIIIELTSGSVPVAGAAIISTAARCGAALSFRGADARPKLPTLPQYPRPKLNHTSDFCFATTRC